MLDGVKGGLAAAKSRDQSFGGQDLTAQDESRAEFWTCCRSSCPLSNDISYA
jgi:hypothetical protein